MQEVEPVPSTLWSGNLSVLKKRWEQPSGQSAQPQNTARQTLIPQPTRPGPVSQVQTDALTSPALLQDHQPEAGRPSDSNHLKPPTDMEAKPSRGTEEAAAAEVPDCERPSVPLNSLKIMFEKGEHLTEQVSVLTARGGDVRPPVYPAWTQSGVSFLPLVSFVPSEEIRLSVRERRIRLFSKRSDPLGGVTPLITWCSPTSPSPY